MCPFPRYSLRGEGCSEYTYRSVSCLKRAVHTGVNRSKAEKSLVVVQNRQRREVDPATGKEHPFHSPKEAKCEGNVKTGEDRVNIGQITAGGH